MKRTIFTLVSILIIGSFTFLPGCSDDNGTGGGVVLDPNVKVFRNLVVHQFNDPTSMSGVNLLTGQVVRADNNMKDIHLADSLSLAIDFYFRSGDLGLDNNGNIVLGDNLTGMETKFGTTIAYLDMTQAQFDTVTRIPVDGELNPNHFLNNETRNYPNYRYFGVPLQYRHVFSFWLVGKSSIAPNDIYGILYLKSTRYNAQDNFEVTIDVKINTGGQNSFRETIPS